VKSSKTARKSLKNKQMFGIIKVVEMMKVSFGTKEAGK